MLNAFLHVSHLIHTSNMCAHMYKQYLNKLGTEVPIKSTNGIRVTFCLCATNSLKNDKHFDSGPA